MKIYIYILLTILFLSFVSFGQSFSKKDLVVPKFSKEAAPYDKINVWQGKVQYKTTVSKTSEGNYALNGNANWTQLNFPIMESYFIDELETSPKKTSKVLLKNLSSMVLITFEPGLDVQQALSHLLFKGLPDEFERTDYFKNIEKPLLSKIFTGKLASIPAETQHSLVKVFGYDMSSITVVDFKEKSYLSVVLDNKFVYNTIQVNDAERASRKTQEALKLLSTIGKQVKNISEVEGVKITSEILSKDFVREKYSKGKIETYEIYTSFSSLYKFIDAEITNQELIDNSIILVDGSRVKVNLTSFS